MQDRYAGDVGDFLNFALLRLLMAPAEDRVERSLGVIWYRVPDERHNDDGKHITYLDDGNRIGARLRSLDPDLHRRLAGVVRGGRSVARIEASGALPAGTVTFPDLLDLRAARGATARQALRDRWIDAARSRVEGCDLVFVDPDNGARRAGHPVPRHRPSAGKHAYLDELAPIVRRGQSLMIYHHADRSGPVEQQIAARLDELRGELPEHPPLAAVRASRGSTRLFLLVAAPGHDAWLADRLRRIEGTRWAEELRVTWARSRPDVGAAPAQNRA